MHLFQNALTMEPQNVSLLVLLMATAAWAGMAIVLLVDVFSDVRLGVVWKFLWLPVILCLPLVSGVLYGAFSLVCRLNALRSN
jgi:hypothetical protein